MSEQWTDDEIIGAILAGGSIRPIRAALGTFGEPKQVRLLGFRCARLPTKQLPCCAVGAGLLFRGLSIKDEQATTAFADKYGVSESVAQGVSDGFEDSEWYRYSHGPTRDDYARGWAIGAAIRSAISDDEARGERSGK